jgi:hypothetical protein
LENVFDIVIAPRKTDLQKDREQGDYGGHAFAGKVGENGQRNSNAKKDINL